MKIGQKLLVLWLAMMFLVTFTSSLVYLVAQQTLRLGANEQPMQLTKDTMLKLENGQSAVRAIPVDKVNIAQSLSPFVMVFDSNKNLLETSGMMGSSSPVYPKGVLDSVAKSGEDRVTWQPQNGLRYATVAVKYSGGFIVAGHSLSETERLIDTIGRLVAQAWLVCVVFSGIALMIIYTFTRKVFRTTT